MLEQKSLFDLGFIEFEDQDKKDILNYAKLIQKQRELRDEIINLANTGAELKNISDFERSLFKEIDKKIDEFFHLWNAFINFFKNPPTQNEFENINHSLILQKAFSDFKEFSDNIARLNLEAQSKEFSVEFENFISNTQAKLENVVSQYDDFLKSFISKQKTHIEPFEDQLNSIVKTYDNSFAKMLRIAKGGILTLIATNIILVLVLGILSTVIYFQKEELEGIMNVSKNFESIKVVQDKNSITFDFDKDKVKILETDKSKRVVLDITK